MRASAAHFPDSFIWAVPVVAHPVDDVAEMGPEVIRDWRLVFVRKVNGVHEFAIDVKLKLVRSSVADANRLRVHVTRQVLESVLLEFMTTVDAVHDLQWPVIRAIDAAILQPFHESTSLFCQTDSQQSVDAERGVSDPGVAIVPIPYSAKVFRKARGGCGDKCASWFVGQEL